MGNDDNEATRDARSVPGPSSQLLDYLIQPPFGGRSGRIQRYRIQPRRSSRVVVTSRSTHLLAGIARCILIPSCPSVRACKPSFVCPKTLLGPFSPAWRSAHRRAIDAFRFPLGDQPVKRRNSPQRSHSRLCTMSSSRTLRQFRLSRKLVN